MQQGIVNLPIEQMIQNVVTASWPELMENDPTPLVHVEYHRTAPNEELEYLKVWAEENKGWKLVCEYWVEPGDRDGVHGLTFSNQFYSASFGHLLKAILENQRTFSDLREQSCDGLIQIAVPTDEERATAVAALQVALTDRGLCDSECSSE
jgi:hypothetical protein